MSLTATDNNIVLGNSVSLQAENGNLFLSAGRDVIAPSGIIQITGNGELYILCDTLFPTPPLFGSGRVDLSSAVLSTGVGRLLIYTSQRSLNTMPAIINGTNYVPGPEFVNSTTEKWGTYYPNSSGIPFTIFYKEEGIVPSRVIINALYGVTTATAGVFREFANPWHKDMYLGDDPKWPRLNLLWEQETSGIEFVPWIRLRYSAPFIFVLLFLAFVFKKLNTVFKKLNTISSRGLF